MKYLLSIIAMLICMNIQAQKSLDKLFKHYKNKNHVMALELTGDMLEFLIKDENQDNSIENVKLLIFNNGTGLEDSEKEELLNDLKKSKLEELATMRSGDGFIHVYVEDEGDYIKRLVLLMDADENEIVGELNGNIHYDKLKDLDINIDGLEGLKNLGRSPNSKKL